MTAVTEMVPTLARSFLWRWEPGAKLPTVREMAQELGHSTSSVHAALTRLEELGAIELETHGRGGAFLARRSLSELWAVAEGGPLVVALPLASSPRYEALATAIKRLLTDAGHDVFLIFVRGSRQRLAALHAERCHLAVMSGFAADQITGPDDAIVTELLPASYNTGHSVYYRPVDPAPRPLRVLVDPKSADQQRLSAVEFGTAGVVTVPAMSSQFVRRLQAGVADAAVWTADELGASIPDGFVERPLSTATLEQVGDRDTRAALVGRTRSVQPLRAVAAVLDPGEVAELQQAVLEGRIVPEY